MLILQIFKHNNIYQALEDEETMTKQQLAIKNVGKQVTCIYIFCY